MSSSRGDWCEECKKRIKTLVMKRRKGTTKLLQKNFFTYIGRTKKDMVSPIRGDLFIDNLVTSLGERDITGKEF